MEFNDRRKAPNYSTKFKSDLVRKAEAEKIKFSQYFVPSVNTPQIKPNTPAKSKTRVKKA